MSKNNDLSINTNKEGHKELKPSQLKLGDSVKVVSMGLKGSVSTLPDAKGNLFVQCGIIRSQVNIKDLVLINEIPSYLKEFTKKPVVVSCCVQRVSASYSSGR